MSILESVKSALVSVVDQEEIEFYESLFLFQEEVGLEAGKTSWFAKKLKTVKDSLDRATNTSRFDSLDDLLNESFENITFTKSQILALKIPIGPHTNALFKNNISLEMIAKVAEEALADYKSRSGVSLDDAKLVGLFDTVSKSFLNKPFFRWNSELLKFRLPGVKLSAIKLHPLSSNEGVVNVPIKELSKINLLRETNTEDKQLAFSLKFSLGGGILYSNEYTKFFCEVIKHSWDEFGNLATKMDSLNTNAVYRNQHDTFQAAMFVYNYLLNMSLHTKYILAQIAFLLNHIDSTYGKVYDMAKKLNKTLNNPALTQLLQVKAESRDLSYYQKLTKELSNAPQLKGELYDRRIPPAVYNQLIRGELINTYVVD